MEGQPPPEEQQPAGALPDMPEEGIGFGASKDQRGAAIMVREPTEERRDQRDRVGRVEPNASVPRQQQAVALDGVVLARRRPRTIDMRCRVKIEALPSAEGF